MTTRGHYSNGWFYGFKLHIISSETGKIVDFMITPGNVDDRKPLKMDGFIFSLSVILLTYQTKIHCSMESKVYSPAREKQPSIFSEIIEAFDLEWKTFHTFRDFIKKPEYVISSYQQGKKQYSNPVKLVIMSGALYWILTSYFVNWNAVATTLGDSYGELLRQILLFIDDDPARAKDMDTLVNKIKLLASDVFQLLMQYVGVYVAVVAIAISTLLYWFTRKYGTSFREIVGFQCYRNAFFIVMLILLMPLGYLNYWLPIGLLLITSLYVEHTNKTRKFSIFPYLKVPKREGRLYLFKSMLVLIIVVMLISVAAGYKIAGYFLN